MSDRATALSAPQPALVASPSSPQAVSTEGFDQAQGHMATPAYCAEMRRAHAKRIARDECQATLAKAYQVLGDAEAEADRAYLAEMAAINADMCREWSDRREAA